MLDFLLDYVFGIGVPLGLICAGVFFAVRLRVFHLRHPLLVLKTLGSPAAGDGPSPARALALALAGTLGVGNIVGVASAIYLGGVGSIFWMWISALCAMLLKYAETVLALAHRRTDRDGARHGGAMYYIRDWLGERGHGLLGAVVAAVFAGLCIVYSFSVGCVIQVSAVSRAFLGVCGIGTGYVGLALAVLTLVVILGGTGSVSGLMSRLVPLMSVGYVLMSVAVMAMRHDALIIAITSIFSDAFTPVSAVGGFVGFLGARGVRYGTMRGLMSNEAGCGTAPIAHSESSATEPAEQGIWGIVEVFVDTILLCTMTALVIIISLDEVQIYGTDPIMMTVRAFSAVLGDWAGYAMCVMVLFFGFATVVCWAHYGLECVGYFSRSKVAKRVFVAAYVALVFFGAVYAPDAVWTVSDLALGAMTLINLAVICPMSGEVVSATESFLRRKLKNGKRH